MLLILENAPGHSNFIGDFYRNIQEVFLSPHTTSLIQPMYRVTATFKTYHQRRTYAQANAATEEDTEKTLMQLWKDYNVYDCIENLAWAWGDDNKECMNGIWKNTLKRFGHDGKGFAKYEEVAKISKSVAEMASNLNLCVDEDDIEEHLEAVPEERINEELLELKQKSIAKEERENKTAGEEKEEKQLRNFTVKCLADFLPDLDKLLKKSENTDPNTERLSLIERNVHGALSTYKKIYYEKRYKPG